MAGQVVLGLGIMGLGIVVHAVTLPVELDASFRRALPVLGQGYLAGRDLDRARSVLRAAALTYEPSALPDGTLAGARGGSGNYSLIVRGRSAHAGRKPRKSGGGEAERDRRERGARGDGSPCAPAPSRRPPCAVSPCAVLLPPSLPKRPAIKSSTFLGSLSCGLLSVS